MSETTGDDVPRDPWGNPLPPEDRAPVNPRPDDFPPLFPNDPPGGAPDNPAWPGSEGPHAPEGQPSPPPPFAPPTDPAPPGNPAWPGATGPAPGSPPPPPAAPSGPPPPGPPPPGNPAWPGSQAGRPTEAPPGWGGQPGPGWGGPGVPPQQRPYPPGGAHQGWGHGAPWAPAKNDGMAIGALVCAIAGLLCFGVVLEPVAIVLGFLSRKRIRESHGQLRGDGLALAAIIVGIVGLVLSVIGFIILVNNPDALDNLFDGLTTTTGG